MCDYSLMHVASRPASVGDKIVSTNFIGTITRGFAAEGEPNVAVCLLPGTELAFEKNVTFYDLPSSSTIRTADYAVAKFAQVDQDKPHVHHDSIEFPDGTSVRLTHLCEDQKCTVLQLGVEPRMINTEGQRAAPPADVTSGIDLPEEIII
jgi:hypothetical protein